MKTQSTPEKSRACPSDNKLVQFAEGRVPEAEQDELVQHLNRCDACRQLVGQLASCVSQSGPDGSRGDCFKETVGTRIGRYVIVQHVGSGGMGEVFAAYDPELDRKVALKLVHSDLMEDSSGGLRARLMREAQAMAKLSHPNVISVYEVLSVDNDVAIAMEFIEGTTLTKWLKEEKRSWKEIRDVFFQAGEGLYAAHKEGFVHRDFKPDNVLIRKDGRVFVTDFGLVRRDSRTQSRPTDGEAVKEDIRGISHLDSELTRAGSLMGTPAYMAPEQLNGKDVDARSDQYSFFVSLYEGLFGERPIEAKSLEEYKKLVNSQEITIPSKSNIPQWLKTIITKGLSKDPKNRYESMAQVLVVLKKENKAKIINSILITLVVVMAAMTGIGSIYLAKEEPITERSPEKFTYKCGYFTCKCKGIDGCFAMGSKCSWVKSCSHEECVCLKREITEAFGTQNEFIETFGGSFFGNKE